MVCGSSKKRRMITWSTPRAGVLEFNVDRVVKGS